MNVLSTQKVAGYNLCLLRMFRLFRGTHDLLIAVSRAAEGVVGS
jgi:hypothetical protein